MGECDSQWSFHLATEAHTQSRASETKSSGIAGDAHQSQRQQAKAESSGKLNWGMRAIHRQLIKVCSFQEHINQNKVKMSKTLLFVSVHKLGVQNVFLFAEFVWSVLKAV